MKRKLKNLIAGPIITQENQTELFHNKVVEEYEKAIVQLTHSYIIAEYVALATARRFPRKLVLDYNQLQSENVIYRIFLVNDGANDK